MQWLSAHLKHNMGNEKGSRRRRSKGICTCIQREAATDVDDVGNIMVLGCVQHNAIPSFAVAYDSLDPATLSFPVLYHRPQILHFPPVVPVRELPLALSVALEIEPECAHSCLHQCLWQTAQCAAILGRSKAVAQDANLILALPLSCFL